MYFVSTAIFSSEDESISFYASLLFAVHPIHTEVVSGIVGRAELLSCIMFLLSLWLYVKSKFPCWFLVILLAGLSFVGLLFKENAIMILVSD